jgi:hypothetical protein
VKRYCSSLTKTSQISYNPSTGGVSLCCRLHDIWKGCKGVQAIQEALCIAQVIDHERIHYKCIYSCIPNDSPNDNQSKA